MNIKLARYAVRAKYMNRQSNFKWLELLSILVELKLLEVSKDTSRVDQV